MASLVTETVNFIKIWWLIYDRGTQAVRSVFDLECPPSSLSATLSTNQSKLQSLKKPKGKVLSQDQFDKLYPKSGASSNSKDFDITLLFVLLRNVCPGIATPATGWNELPPDSDTSREAHLVRIKVHRNKIAHRSKAEITDSEFTTLWDEISMALVSLGLKQDDIKKLKSAPLGEADHKQLLEDWNQANKDIKSQLAAIKSDTDGINDIKNILKEMSPVRKGSAINELAYFEYSSLINRLVESYYPKTREWIFEKVKSYLESVQSKSIAIVIEAPPGMGKSVMAAKICDMYKHTKDVIIGACHFFKHNNILLNDPRLMLQYIAHQLCETVPGYHEALDKTLPAHMERLPQLGYRELLTLLLEQPLCHLKPNSTVVVVIDALDECNNMKNEFCDAFVQQLSTLPSWLRFVITTRPPPSISSFMVDTKIEVKPDDPKNKDDLQLFINDKLKDLPFVTLDHDVKRLVDITEGIFLVAVFVIRLVQKDGSAPGIAQYFSDGEGIAVVYKDYFSRLLKALGPYTKSEKGFFDMLDAVVQAEFPIEKKIFYDILGLQVDEPRVPDIEREEAINLLHQLFPVENNHVSVFHKTVTDWLTNRDHLYRVKGDSRVLAKKCYEVLADIRLGDKNLEEPWRANISSAEINALQHEGSFMKNQNFVESKNASDPVAEEVTTNCFQFCFLFMLRYYIISSITHTYTYYMDLPPIFDRVNKYIIPSPHFKSCRLQSTAETLKHQLAPILQTLHLLGVRLSPKPVDLLKEFGFPYHERRSVMKVKKYSESFDHPFTLPRSVHDNSRIANAIPLFAFEIVPCNQGFFLVQYPSQPKLEKLTNWHTRDSNVLTLLQKHLLDGSIVKEKTFQGRKKMFMSPDNQSIIAIPVFSKENIDIIDTSTLDVHTSYKSPNAIRSCHIYGNQAWYILIRCFDNKIYVIDGKTGKIVHQPVVVDQFDEVEAISSLGHFVLGRNEKTPVVLTDPRCIENIFTDEDGTFFEQMIYKKGNNDMSCHLIRKLFLCHFDDSHELKKMSIYPRKELSDCQNERNIGPIFQPYERQAMTFSQDGRLFAFEYSHTITLVNTSDGSLHSRVCCGNINGVLRILLLTNDTIILYGNEGIYVYRIEFEATQELMHVMRILQSPSPLKLDVLPSNNPSDIAFLVVQDKYLDDLDEFIITKRDDDTRRIKREFERATYIYIFTIVNLWDHKKP